jgi:hypothetical protein
LAGRPFTATLPARHASVARLRVLKMRTAQSHLSTRSLSGEGITAPNVEDRRRCAKDFAARPDVSWRRDASVAFSRDVRDDGVASPKHSLHHRAVLSVKFAG